MRAQEQLGIIEIVVILQRIARAKLDALDLLQIDKEHLLLAGGHAAVFHAGERFLHGGAELPVKERRHAGLIDLVVTRFSRVIHDLAAVHKQHALVVIHVNDRAVGDGIFGSLCVRAALVALANLYARGEYGCVVHGIGLVYLEPRIGQAAADCAYNCFDDAHMLYLRVIFDENISVYG